MKLNRNNILSVGLVDTFGEKSSVRYMEIEPKTLELIYTVLVSTVQPNLLYLQVCPTSTMNNQYILDYLQNKSYCQNRAYPAKHGSIA
jgi:hypothetical protein